MNCNLKCIQFVFHSYDFKWGISIIVFFYFSIWFADKCSFKFNNIINKSKELLATTKENQFSESFHFCFTFFGLPIGFFFKFDDKNIHHLKWLKFKGRISHSLSYPALWVSTVYFNVNVNIENNNALTDTKIVTITKFKSYLKMVWL